MNLGSIILKSEISTWFTNTCLINLDKDLAVIEVPNKYVANWLRENYLEHIKNSFKNNINFLPEIRFVYGKTRSSHEETKYQTKNLPELSINHQLNKSLTFNNFVIAKGNRFAFSSASDIVGKPSTIYNPLYIFSKFVAGKTHLLNAIGNQAVITNPLSNIIYVSIDQLSSDFSLAAKNRKISEFRDKYNNSDLLLIDDIQLVSGKDKLQKELISAINHYRESNKQIAVAGKLPPGLIQNLTPELRSRLEWGLLAELKNPDHKTRMKIIKKKGKDEKISIPDDVAFFLANSTADLKNLSQQLITIGAYVSLNKKEINISLVKSILSNKHLSKINVEDIQKLTSEYFNISLADLLSNKKTHQYSYPRHISMYLSRELTGLSYKELARAFGNKDHSTIINAVKCINRDRELNKTLTDDLNKLRNLLS